MARALTVLLCLGLAAACLLTAGCRGAGRDPDEVAFIVAVGIDAAPGGMLKVSYQIGQASGGGDMSAGAQQQGGRSEVISVVAPTLPEARMLLNSVIAPTVNLSHVKALVISEEMARGGLQDIVGLTGRFREFRGSVFVIVAGGPAEEFLRQNKPLFAFTVAKYYELMMATAVESGYFDRSQLHDFILRMKSVSAEATVAYAALTRQIPAEGLTMSEVPGQKGGQIKAGEIPRQGGNAPEFLGAAVFQGDRMVGVLDNQETRALAVVTGKYMRGFVTVADPLEPKRAVVVNVGLDEKPKIKGRLEGGRAVFVIYAKLEGEIVSIPSGINYEEPAYRTLLEAQVANVFTGEIRRMLDKTQALNADVVGLGYRLHRHFRTFPDWRAFDWHNRYNQAEIDVQVEVTLRRTGLMWKTTVIPGH